MKRKRKLWEIIAPNPSVRYGMAEKLNVGHWMKVETPYGKKLQVYEHGIGKEGGTSILLRHGYTGGMRSVSHDPAEYLVEVSNVTGTKKSERVLFAHTDREIVTIDGNGSVGQYSVEEVFDKIGFSGEWWYRRIVTNVTRNLGIIFIWVRPSTSTYWYIVDKDFNVILSGVLDGYDVVLYTYYNNKLRVTMSNWDDDTYTWAEWTKDGIRRTGPIDYNFLDIAGRYCITRDSEYIRFIDYETGDTVSYELLNRWCIIRVKSVGYNQFRVYVVYWYIPARFRFRDLLNRLPGVGSYLSFEELMPEYFEGAVYEFYINDRDVRFEGKVSGNHSGNIISRKDASAYGLTTYDGHYCGWVSRENLPPYGASEGGMAHTALYNEGTVLLSLNNIDYTPKFTLPKDDVVIFRRFYPYPEEHEIRLAVNNREVWFRGSSADDVISGAVPVSFNPDTEEAYIVLVLKGTNEKVYFKVTKDRIERVDGFSSYQLVFDSVREPAYLDFVSSGYCAKCRLTDDFNISISARVDDCREVDPDLFSEALSEALYVMSFCGDIVGYPYNCICEGPYPGRVFVRLSYFKSAYHLRFVRPGSYTTVSYKEKLVPHFTRYIKVAVGSTYLGGFTCYDRFRETQYNNPPLRGIDGDYESSDYNVKIGNYWYSRYLIARNCPTFIFKAVGGGKHLIYGLSHIVLLSSNNTFKNLICNTFNSTSNLMLNKKAVVKANTITNVVASDGKNIRWVGELNGIEGEYLNDRLLFRGSVEYIGGGCNFAAIRRRENTEWVTYIADVDTLMSGERGVVLDKVRWYFYDFDAQDVFVFGTSGIKLRNVR